MTPGEEAMREAARLEAARVYAPRPHAVHKSSPGRPQAPVDEAALGRKRLEQLVQAEKETGNKTH